jgi:hypothetical protein
MKKKKQGGRATPYNQWDDTYYVKVYQLARLGYTKLKICKALGIPHPTLNKWLKARPALVQALDEGRANQTAKPLLKQYVYDRLPAKLQKMWEELESLDNDPNTLRRINKMFEFDGLKSRQHIFLHALVNSSFNPSEACKLVGVNLRDVRSWARKDIEFAELLDEIQTHKKNFFESALVKKAGEGDVAAIIFANKTLNSDRGYNEKQEIKVSGSINHTHTVINVDQLNLPLEVRRQIFQAMEKLESDNTPKLPSPDVVDVEYSKVS